MIAMPAPSDLETAGAAEPALRARCQAIAAPVRSTAVTLFGLDEPSPSEPLLIYGINASSGSITLENESASATEVAARWRTADALDKVIAPNGIWLALHDRQINRWRVL